MQSLLKSLSPVERRIYWRWTLVVLAFYALLLVIGGSIVVLHRSIANAEAAAGHYDRQGGRAHQTWNERAGRTLTWPGPRGPAARE